MKRFQIVCGGVLSLICYYFFILSLMSLFPMWISAPLLFTSLLLTLSPLAARKRFKGFR